MPVFSIESLKRIGCELFEAAGCRPEDAEVVVDHLVESNVFGHDSHGAIRFVEYVRGIREGLYRAATSPKVVKDRPCAAVVDGQGALGPIGASLATNLAIQKARTQGVASVALRNTCHIGRVGAYPLMAARQGLIGQIFVNAGHHGVWVAPYGGTEGRLSTNPIAFAAPRRDDEPIMLDMTTSVAAIGKVWVADHRGEALPEGWIIDSKGRPSTDPKALLSEPYGAILPMGGSVGYKGYGLALMMEVLGGALSGQGCAIGEREVVSNGVLITCYHIEHFVDIDSYYDEVESVIRHIRSSRPAPGFDRILLPGELEFAGAREKQRDGIDIDDTTWRKICVEARDVGLEPEKWLARDNGT